MVAQGRNESVDPKQTKRQREQESIKKKHQSEIKKTGRKHEQSRLVTGWGGVGTNDTLEMTHGRTGVRADDGNAASGAEQFRMRLLPLQDEMGV